MGGVLIPGSLMSDIEMIVEHNERERGKENPINSTRECEITNRVKSWDFKKKVNGTKEVNKKCKEIKTLPRNYSKMPKISKMC